MKLHLGSDHAGFTLKEHLRSWLTAQGHEVLDHGTTSGDRVDYPDFAARVARAVQASGEERGILVCGSGIGVSMTANRFPGVRAVVAVLEIQARLARAHNDANVLCLGGRITTPEHAEVLVDAFLSAPFEGGRHGPRVEKIDGVAVGEPNP